jgi:hypothetical protein
MVILRGPASLAGLSLVAVVASGAVVAVSSRASRSSALLGKWIVIAAAAMAAAPLVVSASER